MFVSTRSRKPAEQSSTASFDRTRRGDQHVSRDGGSGFAAPALTAIEDVRLRSRRRTRPSFGKGAKGVNVGAPLSLVMKTRDGARIRG
jgi:hypothetical protein